jgi:hypothetical protein
MSSQINTLQALLSTTQDLELFLARSLEFKQISIAALEQVLQRARETAEALAAELAEKRKIIQETEAALSAAAEAEAEAQKPAPRVWRVSDCHSHCSTGAWALEATQSGSYGVCVSAAEDAKNNTSVRLVTGGTAQISKKRLSPKKGVAVTDIAVGDTLFMGDKKRNLVFKGTVKSQSVKGFFRSADLSVNSFRRRVGEREARGNNTFRPLEEEVEMMWEVDWKPVGALTEEWKEYIRFSDRPTFLPLEGAPPAY